MSVAENRRKERKHMFLEWLLSAVPGTLYLRVLEQPAFRVYTRRSGR